ncbi:unnamed protein product, partial [Meganyctiphanes norvegica]
QWPAQEVLTCFHSHCPIHLSLVFKYLTMLLKLVTFIIVLINSSTADSECLIDNHKSDNDIIREFLTVLQRMQSDTSENFRSMHSATSEILQSMHSATSENLRTIQSTTSVNIQSVISTINRQASSTDANLVNVIDAVESVSVETNAWRNDLSEIMTNMLNKTMNMILVNIDDNNKEFRVNDTLEQIETFTKTLESKLNSAMNGIREDLLTGMAKMLDQKMNVLIESYNSSLVQISNQMVQNNADVLSSQSAELSSIQETLSEINNVLAKVNNDTTHSVTNRVNIIDAVENNNQILQTQSNEISLLKETLADMNNVLAEMKTSTAFIKPKMEARNETTDTLNGDGVSIIDAVEKNNQIMQTQSNEISSVKETLADINSVLAELKNSTTCIKANMEVRNETTDMIDSDGESDIDVSHKAVPSGFTSYNGRIVLL